jgi:hypothetical protein
VASAAEFIHNTRYYVSLTSIFLVAFETSNFYHNSPLSLNIKQMRLRLIVQRHCLPPVQLLWTVGDVPLPFTPEPAATISQFLEQVNEVIPLESEDWGLEDYAVEVRGFECLHFSELSHILREDDEVR